MNLDKVNRIFTIFSSLSKEPKTELEYINNFTLAVAVILSAQSTDVSVNKATKELFKTYKTPRDFLNIGVDDLKTYIKSLNFYKTKAKNIIALCQILVDKYQGEIPNNFDDLVKLPGIGRKTANVILSAAFGKSVIAVDTHVGRVANRIGLTKETLPDKVEADLHKVIPKIWLKNAHNWLVLHGRYICKARKPQCISCPILDLCEYDLKTKNN